MSRKRNKGLKIDEELNILNTNYLGTITNVTDISLKTGNNNIYYFCSVYSTYRFEYYYE